MWLLESLKLLMCVRLGAGIIFLLNGAGLEPRPAHSRHRNRSGTSERTQSRPAVAGPLTQLRGHNRHLLCAGSSSRWLSTYRVLGAASAVYPHRLTDPRAVPRGITVTAAALGHPLVTGEPGLAQGLPKPPGCTCPPQGPGPRCRLAAWGCRGRTVGRGFLSL